MATQQHEAITEFIERLGMVSQAGGAARISGRLMALLIVEAKPVSFSDCAIKLQVSRGSISTNAKHLEGLGVIERVSLPGERQDYFRIPPKPYLRMVKGQRANLDAALDMVVELKNKMPEELSESKDGMQVLIDYYQAARDAADYQIKLMDE